MLKRWIPLIGLFGLSYLLGIPGRVTAESVYVQKPLLMEGKRTLYQRVLTRPGAALLGVQGEVVGKSLPTFTLLYVYSRKISGGIQWVEVGSSPRNGVEGWILADQLTDWHQSIVAVFGNPAGRDRLPLFREKNYALDLLESENAVAGNKKIIADLSRGRVPADTPVISLEPENYIDFTKPDQFYLLPILQAEEVYLETGFKCRLLKIAAVPEQEKKRLPQSRKATRTAYKTGIVFVIDTTKSMEPYIQRTRQAVRTIYRQLETAGLISDVSFGMVGFRDDHQGTRGLEYVSKIFVPLEKVGNPTRFLQQAKRVKAAQVSSRHFKEDAYAGVLTAIEEMDWTPFAARLIIMITDAGPRDAGDPLSSSGMSAGTLSSLATEKGIALFSLHLLTPAGKENHEEAEARYRRLAHYKKTGDRLYYPVAVGSAEAMGTTIEAVSGILTRQVHCMNNQKDSECDFSALEERSVEAAGGDRKLTALKRNTARVGHAMALAYYGRQEGTAAPAVFEAWVADRDAAHPEKQALEIRILLTKNQLSDLQEGIKAIIAAGEKGQLSPKDFFDEIKSAAIVLSRTPDRVGKDRFRNLAESGLLGEYLTGLPYKSKVMSLTQAYWMSLSVGEQQAFLDELEAKLKLYRHYNENSDLWRYDLGGKTTHAGEAVYPVPLDDLP